MEAVVKPDIFEEARECVGDVVGRTWVLEAVVYHKIHEGPGATREGLAIKEVVQALVVGSEEEG